MGFFERSAHRGRLHLKYKNADNHKVFAKLQTWINAGYCATSPYLSCTSQYYYYTEKDTARSNDTSKWVTKSAKTGVPGTADYARAGIQVKLDIPLRTDVSSNVLWTNGAKY